MPYLLRRLFRLILRRHNRRRRLMIANVSPSAWHL